MKKPSNIFIMFTFLLSLLILTSCQKPTPEPDIRISHKSNELKVINYFDRNNEEKEDIEEYIKSVMVGKRFTDLPAIDFGDKISLEALNFETDEFEIYDYIVDESGNIVSDYGADPTAITLSDNGNAEFVFEKIENLDMYNDYMVEGKSIHCLLVRCKINKSSFAFGTLVLGDLI